MRKAAALVVLGAALLGRADGASFGATFVDHDGDGEYAGDGSGDMVRDGSDDVVRDGSEDEDDYGSLYSTYSSYLSYSYSWYLSYTTGPYTSYSADYTLFPDECAPFCTFDMLGDGKCQRACRNEACEDDRGDCAHRPPLPSRRPSAAPSQAPVPAPSQSQSHSPTQSPSAVAVLPRSAAPAAPPSAATAAPTAPTTAAPTAAEWHKLTLRFVDAHFDPERHDTAAFKEEVADYVRRALGLGSGSVRVLNVRSGSVLVEVEIKGVTEVDGDALVRAMGDLGEDYQLGSALQVVDGGGTPAPSSTPEGGASGNTGAIIGGVLGGLALLLCLGALTIKLRRSGANSSYGSSGAGAGTKREPRRSRGSSATSEESQEGGHSDCDLEGDEALVGERSSACPDFDEVGYDDGHGCAAPKGVMVQV